MAGFPNANGGILSMSVSASTAFQGQSSTFAVQLQAYAGSANNYTYSVSGQPQWIAVDNKGQVTLSPPTATTAGNAAYAITATNVQTGKSRTLAASVYVMATDVVASGPSFPASLKAILAARSGDAGWLRVRPPLRACADGAAFKAELDALASPAIA